MNARCRKEGAKPMCYAGDVSLTSGHSHFLVMGLDLSTGFPSPSSFVRGNLVIKFLGLQGPEGLLLAIQLPPASHECSDSG